MDNSKKSDTAISRILNVISEWPAFVATLAMGAMIVFGVITRYLFNYPVSFVDEYTGYLNVILIVLPLCYVLRKGDHIRVDILFVVLPKRVVRFLKLANLALSLAIVIVLTVGTARLTIVSFAAGTRAYTPMETLLGPIQILMPIGFILFAIQIIMEMGHTWKRPIEK